MSTGERGRMPALDGVRGLAIALVVIQHVSVGVVFFNHFGVVGVTIFFVLSGYLITRLLLADQDRRARIGLRRFYGRRAARLLPGLLALLALTPPLLWLLNDPSVSGATVAVPLAGLYLMDFFVASGHNVTVLGHTWSLAVEEQFYALWPLVLIAATRMRLNVTRVACALLAVALAWHVAASYLFSMERVYFGPDTTAFTLLAGCVLACLERDGLLPELGWRAASLAGLCLVALCFAPLFPDDTQWLQVAVVALAVPLILSARTATAGWLMHPLMRWLGQVSYGWYLWHGVLVWVGLGAHSHLGRVAMGLISLGVAWLSFRYVERPFLRRRKPTSVRVVADPVSSPLVGEVHAAR